MTSRAGSRRLVLRAGPFSALIRARSLAVGVATASAALALGVLSLGLGTYTLAPGDVVGVLLGGGGALDRTVVLEWRLPRTVAALTLGAMLAVAGALFQRVTRNPLASPDILGLSNGAFTGMLLTIVFVSPSGSAISVGALVGALATAAVIWLMAQRAGAQGFRLIVVGIGISALLASANTWMLLEVELETALFASAWGAGSLNGVTADAVGSALLWAMPVTLLLGWLSPRLAQMDLGDDVAAGSGARPALTRAVALLAGVALVAIATVVIGPVAFVSLAAPQVGRLLARTPSLSLGVSAAAGALLLLVSDIVAQHLLPASLPVGVVTVTAGGLYLVFAVLREIRR